MKKYTFKVSITDAGGRADNLLMFFLKDKEEYLSRTHIQKLIHEGKITLKGGNLKPHYKVKAQDEFSVILEEKGGESVIQPEEAPLDIIYQDDDIAVINKPAGLVVHAAPGHPAHTLVNALLYHFKELSNVSPQRPGIVHRLDKDTSGLMLIAKSNFAHLKLAEQFADHSIKKKYIAIVKGIMEFDEQIIELPIGRHLYKRQNMAVSFNENARYAKTHYRTLKRGEDFSVLELEPFTGRTHQLRVHLAYILHPILGDVKYGKNNKFSRLALHALYIGFKHPRAGKFMEFSSPLPAEFEQFFK